MSNDLSPKRKSWIRRMLGVALIFFAGIVFAGLFNGGLEYTNRTEFCTSCHSMKTNLAELEERVHWKSRSGVHAGCADCHVPKDFKEKMIANVMAAKDVYHEIMGTIDTPEKYEARRLDMAQRAWAKMKASDSRECKSCHNFGQTSAIAAGIDHARGEVIILMDADLQNDPGDIPRMLVKLDEGNDVVSGWRNERQDQFITRTLPSNTANWLISTVTGVHLHDYGCTLKAYRREVITGFRLYGEMHRFIPAYARSVGARIAEMPVTHHPQRFGKTKYGLSRTMRVILDLFTVKFLISYAQKPIYLFGGLGLGLMGLSSVALLFLLVRRLAFGTSVIQSPIFATALMMFLIGIQSIFMGLIAELLVRTYHESQNKPVYRVESIERA